MKSTLNFFIRLFLEAFQFLFFIIDSIVSFTVYCFGILGFSKPGILNILKFSVIVFLSFFLAVLGNTFLASRWSDIDRLATPILLESGSAKLDNLQLNYGFELRDPNAGEDAIISKMGSYLQINGDTKLFEIRIEAERRKIKTNRWLDPETCYSVYMTLPSKAKLREQIQDESVRTSFSDRQDIYEVCQFGFPFPSVSEVQVSLDRLSLLELMKQEFNDVFEASSSKDASNKTPTKPADEQPADNNDIEGGASPKSPKDLTEIRKVEVRDVYFNQFLGTQGVFGAIEKTPAEESSQVKEAVEKCISNESMVEGFCARIYKLLDYVLDDGTHGADTNVKRCGHMDSVYSRICSAQTAMFTNGRVQFITLVVFFFGLLQLSLVFVIGVATPFWIRLAKGENYSSKFNTGTAVTQMISTKRFTQLYPDLVAPIIAAIEILPMIGFFGTIIGISGAMTEVTGVKSSDKIIELLSLGSMTTNIGVAFETTKFALILSAILLFLKLLTDRLQALSSERV